MQYRPQPAPAKQGRPADSPASGTVELPDGRRLVQSASATARELQRHQWVQVDGRPWFITDLRAHGTGGRILHLAGRGPHTMTMMGSVITYTVLPPASPPTA